MQLLEAISISLFCAIIVATVDTVRIKHTKKIRVFGPSVWKFNESGALIKAPVDSVPSGLLEAAVQGLYTVNKLPKFTAPRKTNTVLFAAASFISELIILSILF